MWFKILVESRVKIFFIQEFFQVLNSYCLNYRHDFNCVVTFFSILFPIY